MKKLKSLFLKIKSKRTIKTYQQPLLITIIDFILLSLSVIVVAAILGMVLDKEYFQNSFIKALAHFFSCMLTANTITKMMDLIETNVEVVLLSVAVIAAEMVLFSGAVIATLTTAVKNYIDKKSNAGGKIVIQNHFVILGWNSKVPEMIYNLILKGYKSSVVVLSDKDKDFVNAEIDSLLSIHETGKNKRKLQLLVKVGNPLLHGDLDDISIDKASEIVVVSREDMEVGEDVNISDNDLVSLKTALALGNFELSSECNVVIETDSDQTKLQIENLAATLENFKNKSVIPVSFNRKIGQIIAQTILEPRMADLYSELFSFEGCEFYSYGNDEIEDFLSTHDKAIPVVRYDSLFALSDGYDSLASTRRQKTDLGKVKLFSTKEPPLKTGFNIFVIGDNKKARFIKENLNFAESNGSDFKTFSYEKNDTQTLIRDIKNANGKKTVLILSDDTVSGDSYDANVFVTLMAMQTAFEKEEYEKISFITELLDSKNYNIVKDFNVKNAIISNKMMSLLLTQLALNKDSKKFFEGLLKVDTEFGGDSFDIKIERAGDIIADADKLSFENRAELIQSFYLSFKKKFMLLGYIRNGEIVLIPLDQDAPKPISLTKEDELVFIKY